LDAADVPDAVVCSDSHPSVMRHTLVAAIHHARR
jgi:hypothetical protein